MRINYKWREKIASNEVRLKSIYAEKGVLVMRKDTCDER